jgi:glycosyltransferase involved in cell wall biosynthesis
MKIGVIDLSMSGWAAGANYSRMVVESLRHAGGDVLLLASEHASSTAPVVHVPSIRPWPGEGLLRRWTGEPERSAITAAARAAGVEVILPVIAPLSGSRVPARLGWIPDFQHRHLPQLFNSKQIAELDRRFTKLANDSDLVMVSSESAREDFSAMIPSLAAKVRVSPFPSLFAFDPPQGDVEPVAAKYRLPRRFALVVNQFWQHKNHIVVPRALGILAARGIRVPTIMIGQPSDYRDKQNRCLSALLQENASQGVWEQCRILGQVSREELVALLRAATMLIQPSLFEGWNTSVQDAKALGCPVVASDLPVHREQLGPEGMFFAADQPEKLAERLGAAWNCLPDRPDVVGEKQALERERIFAGEHGRKLLAICQETAAAR